MPRELRTPRERLEAVAVLRDGLAQLLELAADVDANDLDFFESALIDAGHVRPTAAGSAGEQLDFVRSILCGMLGRLGALVDAEGDVHLLPLGLPASETPEGIVTSMTPGAPGPQPRVVSSPAPVPFAADAPSQGSAFRWRGVASGHTSAILLKLVTTRCSSDDVDVPAPHTRRAARTS